jgi:hypothetical protein
MLSKVVSVSLFVFITFVPLSLSAQAKQAISLLGVNYQSKYYSSYQAVRNKDGADFTLLVLNERYFGPTYRDYISMPEDQYDIFTAYAARPFGQTINEALVTAKYLSSKKLMSIKNFLPLVVDSGTILSVNRLDSVGLVSYSLHSDYDSSVRTHIVATRDDNALGFMPETDLINCPSLWGKKFKVRAGDRVRIRGYGLVTNPDGSLVFDLDMSISEYPDTVVYCY